MKKILIAMENKNDLFIDYRYRENLDSSDSLYTSAMANELKILLTFDADKLRKLFAMFNDENAPITQIYKNLDDMDYRNAPRKHKNNIRYTSIKNLLDSSYFSIGDTIKAEVGNAGLDNCAFDKLMDKLYLEEDCGLAIVFIERKNRFLVIDTNNEDGEDAEDGFVFYFNGKEFKLNTADAHYYARFRINRSNPRKKKSEYDDPNISDFFLDFNKKRKLMI